MEFVMNYGKITLALLAPVIALMLVGCGGQLDRNIATLNAAATAAASGGALDLTLPSLPGSELLTPQPTDPPNTYDLTTNPTGELVSAWGQVYTLGSGSQFTIRATEDQAGRYVIQNLQANGWQDTVKGGSIAIGSGQVRVDLALQIAEQNGQPMQFGAGTVTFQPTLDSSGNVRLNVLGADFGTLSLPANFTGAIGDAVHSMLTGAPNANLSKGRLTQITLESNLMAVNGTIK
jgi:hypothetical protein